MKKIMKLGIPLLIFVMIFPMVNGMISTQAATPVENWGVAPTDTYYYTVGLNGSINLPGAVWDQLSDAMWNGINQAFNNSYDYGYGQTYPDGYSVGYAGGSYNNTYSEYSDEYHHGMFDGWNTGFNNGNSDYVNNFTVNTSYNNIYENVTAFPGFPASEQSALNAQTIFANFFAMEKVFNLKVTVGAMNHFDTVSDYNQYEQYSYDQINVTVEGKLASDTTYLPMEDLVLNYMDNNLRNFITTSFPTNIAGNLTAGLDDAIFNIQNVTSSPSYQPLLDNRALVWCTGVNFTDPNADYFQNTMLEIAQSFGIMGFIPQNMGYMPLFIPQDLDIGAQIEKVKDLANAELIKSHAAILGGFNGIVDQLGLNFITNEKQVYVSGNLQSPKYMFGSIIDLFGSLLVDQVNMGLGTSFDNTSLAADGVFNMKWTNAGVLDNLHVGMHVGAKESLIPYGAHLGFDISLDPSAGSVLNTKFSDNPLPTQKSYPSSINGNWGVSEGSVNDFTIGTDLNVKLPQVLWDQINTQMFDAMNYTYAHDNYDYGWSDGYFDGYNNGYNDGMNSYNNGPFQNNYDKGYKEGMNPGWNAGNYDYNNALAYQTSYNNTHENYTLVGLPTNETVDSEAIMQAFIAQIPTVINLQAKVTDMLGLDESVNNSGTIGTHQYDFVLSSFMAKLPADSSYRPIGTLIMDVYNGLYSAVQNSFPQTYANYILGRMDTIMNTIISQYVPGTSISIFDIITQFVPTLPTFWGIDASGDPAWPSWAKDLGVVDENWGDFAQSALPSILYIPTDTNFSDAYTNLISWLGQKDPNFNEDDLVQKLHDLSIEDYYVNPKEVYVRWDAQGINDIFFQTLNLTGKIQNFITNFNTEYGVQFINTSIDASMTATIRYDSNGILDNLHFQTGFSVMATNGEKLSFASEFDISHGQYAKMNQKFTGEPLIHSYDHWIHPDYQFTFSVPMGNNQQYNIVSADPDVSMTLNLGTAHATRISAQIWASNPAADNPGFTNDGLYFALDVQDESAINFPVTLTMGIPADMSNLSKAELQQLFTVYTWNDANSTWVDAGYTVTIDNVTNTISIVMTHFSAYAVGLHAPPSTTQPNPFNIPGYELPFFIIAMIGAVGFVLYKNKKRT